MQIITISGNLGRDPELRSTNNDQVLSFSVGVQQGYGDQSSTNWFRCSVWGKRAEALSRIMRKGQRVHVVGQFTIGEYQGKPQYDVRVVEVDVQKAANGDGGERRQESQGNRGGGGGGFAEDDLGDDVPFTSADPRHDMPKRRVL